MVTAARTRAGMACAGAAPGEGDCDVIGPGGRLLDALPRQPVRGTDGIEDRRSPAIAGRCRRGSSVAQWRSTPSLRGLATASSSGWRGSLRPLRACFSTLREDPAPS
jgi:hypothetical protein